MNDAGKQITFVLEGEALEAARTWLDAMRSCRDETLALNEEYNRRKEEINSRNIEMFRGCWFKIAEAIGVDPETTWQNPQWGVDFQYLADHELAFVIHRPNPDTVLEGLLGSSVPPSDPSKLN